MLDFAAKFSTGQSYGDFLKQYGTDEQRRRWRAMHEHIRLSPDQKELLGSFTRDMQVICLAGAWCGDCVNQCPIFDHFAAATPRISLRFFDRDAHPDLGQHMQVCGAARVPAVLFLSEDNFPCGMYGDRTLSKYRSVVAGLDGAFCPSGIVGDEDALVAAVVQDWLDEFERVQWILRTSGRLRQKHGD